MILKITKSTQFWRDFTEIPVFCLKCNSILNLKKIFGLHQNRNEIRNFLNKIFVINFEISCYSPKVQIIKRLKILSFC